MFPSSPPRHSTHVVFLFALLVIAAASCGTSGNKAGGGGTGTSSGGSGGGTAEGGTSTSSGGGPDGSPGDGSSSGGSEPDVFIPATDAGMIPTSNRVEINMGVTPWLRFLGDPTGAQAPTFDDSAWTQVGIPNTWNDDDTFVNNESGGGTMVGGTNWYRKHFTVASTYSNRKILVEFEGVHMACQVYINGTFLPGNIPVAADSQATHVVGFVGFVVDITKYVQLGTADNVLAVRVGMNGGGVEASGTLQSGAFFEDPQFSEVFRFGQADGGIFRPVWMHITDPIHIPQNLYATLRTWGTYVATTAASPTSATVKIETNVQNESGTDENVTLTTEVVDATGAIVATSTSAQMVPGGALGADGSAASETTLFTQTATIANPHLWYPSNNPNGGPYMYRVWHLVQVNGQLVDAMQSPLGIRTITWDANLPSFNGQPTYLQGAASRYDYPALGTAVPEEQQWRDLQLLTAAGGNLWRPGHSSHSPEFVNAADYLGVMVDQPSGDGEGQFSAQGLAPPGNLPAPLPADTVALKDEIHTEMIVRDRNHPSILDWESNNGTMEESVGAGLLAIVDEWDNITPRASADRTPDPKNGTILGCTLTGCEFLVKTTYPNNPAWGAEYWGRQSARYAYDYQIDFVAEFLDNWQRSRVYKAFGIAQWYLAETPGEAGTFLEGVGGAQVRSFGSSMTDFSRIPKLLYYAYMANWVPYATKPVVALAHHWNRSGVVTVNAFSNCPAVKLSLNGTQIGTNQTPNPLGTSQNQATDLTEQATDLPHEVSWQNVTWASGTLRADCVDASGNLVAGAFDQRVTAGAPDHIVLTVMPEVVRPDGSTFQITANGTDAAFILATVVDKQGNWVPAAGAGNGEIGPIVTFAVSGPGEYRGGTDQLVTAGQPQTYHAPLDPNLNVEGGMQKIAVRAQFTPGTVTVTATSPGLGSGMTTFTIVPVTQ